MARLFGRRATEKERRDELLSAYLDDQLNAEERAGLEAQLAIDPDLRAELNALRHTVDLVRDLPPVPVPRNFILPQTAADRPQPVRPAPLRRAWAAPFLTAATAVFGLLFAVVLASDLLLSAGGMAYAPMPEIQMLREAEMPQEAPASAPAGQAVVEVTRIVEAEGEIVVETVVEEVVAEVEVTVAVEAEVVVAEKVVSTPTPAPAPAEAPLAAISTVTPEPEGFVAETRETEEAADAAQGGGGPVEEPAAPALTSTPGLTAMETEDDAATSAPETAVPGVNVGAPEAPPSPEEAREATPWAIAEEEAVEEAAEAAPERPEQGPEDTLFARIRPWRALEAVLGLITLVLIGTTIWAWRVRRR